MIISLYFKNIETMRYNMITITSIPQRKDLVKSIKFRIHKPLMKENLRDKNNERRIFL